MFMVEIRVDLGLSWEIGRPKILQLLIMGTQFLNSGQDPDWDLLTLLHPECTHSLTTYI